MGDSFTPLYTLLTMATFTDVLMPISKMSLAEKKRRNDTDMMLLLYESFIASIVIPLTYIHTVFVQGASNCI